ncbi:RNA polymerase sigma-70 factor [Pedobacter nutrimenti]|jgi:RNA polymerase sigma-70 factor (ECF subfamily)|uniref:RNA polymerase sigma-70 factor (ECF subfamily) n=1 Tax=Pedobacter nutrimenti TaxID=1241337 RepID=A0A318UQJ0_9SPHI|nr:RNA polymerase sigma-70 factor [Pedobacter nutrimenti]PYF72998.1 RNA polymerase sigma-70 factor (ECF subfamily) [Pedobacter nutrimenti]
MSFQHKELPDQILLEECRRDSRLAYEALFDRYTPRLYKFGLKYLHDSQTTEELVMDLMLWVWNKRHSIDLKTEFSAYIFRAMRNSVISHLRKKVLETTPIDLLLNELAFSGKPADQDLEYKETESLYLEKLALLSPQRQKVFRMSREENMSYREIAQSMNLSVNTVENYMAASLAFFRTNLKEYTDIPTLILLAFLLGT